MNIDDEDIATINPFVREPEEYKRNVDIKRGYIRAMATAIHNRHPQYEMDYCEEYVETSMKEGGTNEIKDPRVSFISQRKRGNRQREVGRLTEYLKEITDDQKLILTPSLIAYQRPEVTKSLLSEFLFGNVRLRKNYKDLKFKYEQEGNELLTTFYNILQTSVKEINNSLSGAGVSKFNAIYCKSSHLSLTSGCRSATSYANASNERFIMGNRHYHSPQVVLQELSNAQCLAPHDIIMEVIHEYNIAIPSYTQVMECVLKSSRKYWNNPLDEEHILEFVFSMNDASRAAFCYVGDAYHLSKFNVGLVEDIILEFVDASRTYEPHEFSNVDFCKKLDKDKQVTVALLRSELMPGKKFHELKEKHIDEYNQVNTTAKNFQVSINKHAKFIDAFWRPRYLPSSIGKFKSIVREAVVTSDTDSSIFTTQYWTNKVVGKYDFSKRSFNVGYVVVYFASQIVGNALSLLCGNMGIGAEQLSMLQMKNEYYFPVYCLTNISKHYMALQSACEGVVFNEPKLEMKGVHLISSKASVSFMEDFQSYVKNDILTAIMNDKMPSYEQIMNKPILEELRIRKDIRNLGYEYYSHERINDPENYKQGEDNATYFQYLMWREVFAPKYGSVDRPPLYAVRIPVDLSKPKKLKAWVEHVKANDYALGDRLEKFLNKQDKTQLSSILVPEQIVQVDGVPVELAEVIDEVKATSQIMTPYYIALQGFGFYVGNCKNTRLLTDSYIDGYMSGVINDEDLYVEVVA